MVAGPPAKRRWIDPPFDSEVRALSDTILLAALAEKLTDWSTLRAAVYDGIGEIETSNDLHASAAYRRRAAAALALRALTDAHEEAISCAPN